MWRHLTVCAPHTLNWWAEVNKNHATCRLRLLHMYIAMTPNICLAASRIIQLAKLPVTLQTMNVDHTDLEMILERDSSI